MTDLHEPGPSQGHGGVPLTPVRRLTLADGLILIAAVAVGLGIARIPQTTYRNGNSRDELVSLFVMTLMAIYWSSLSVMIALIPMRLMRPRPPLRRIRRQPGFIACAAVAFGTLHMALYFSILRFWNRAISTQIDVLSLIASPMIGSLVISAWFVLALSGRWRSERSWIDRTGRALAIGWIVVYVVSLFLGSVA